MCLFLMQLFLPKLSHNLLPKDGEVYYLEQFLSSNTEKELFLTLKELCSWQQESITIFGKKLLSPRLTCYYGTQSYTYSGVEHPPKPYPEAIKSMIERLNKEYQLSFNSVLLNYYRNGQDSMGWHQDNEKELGKNPVIASINLGATRKFSFKHCIDKNAKLSIPLVGGSLLLMKGTVQHHWKHQLPKTALSIGERINLTFRLIKK